MQVAVQVRVEGTTVKCLAFLRRCPGPPNLITCRIDLIERPVGPAGTVRPAIEPLEVAAAARTVVNERRGVVGETAVSEDVEVGVGQASQALEDRNHSRFVGEFVFTTEARGDRFPGVDRPRRGCCGSPCRRRSRRAARFRVARLRPCAEGLLSDLFGIALTTC
jgi:hypothetical protein